MEKITPAKLAYDFFEPESEADIELPPIFFLHHLSGNRDLWRYFNIQIVANFTKRKCYTIDARNHGDSEYTEVFNFDVLAVDLLHFMDTHHIEKAVLVGSSMGGITAMRTALMKPERVEKLVSIDMGVKRVSRDNMKIVSGFVSLWSNTVESIPKDLNDIEAVDYFLDHFYSKLPPNAESICPRETLEKIKFFLLLRDPMGDIKVRFNKAVVQPAIENYDTLQTDPVGTFGGPALFLYGEKSILNVKQEEDTIKKHFPKAELMEFKGASHTLHLEFPEKFLETMTEFVSK